MFRRLLTSLRNWIRKVFGADDQETIESIPSVPPGTATPAGEPSSTIPTIPTIPTTPTIQSESGPSARETAAAQSILENESLTADLDDAAANALLEWGVANARMVARSVGVTTLFDDSGSGGSDIAMSERLRAVGRMMRAVNAYVSGTGGAGGGDRDSALKDILEQAAVVYGRTFAALSAEQRAAFINAQATLLHNPVQLINNLRRFIEEQNKEE
jgi:hypothetical protein